ncbi:hypothetical protein RPD_0505 [Rhodopseudomonas palustris BisB5]|uniref:Uncharacterized protein n=1 Tax=Rhodopseudomonas palustris (strain BisB5) TaxID=316057 RepID=Q13DU6_RHOPS|nr:hypothetical protein RPD_0505 [Rhodopseudomonas palustris BisB5]
MLCESAGFARAFSWCRFLLVSRARCSVVHAAPQTRDPGCFRHVQNRGPGSAAHHVAARRVAMRPGHDCRRCCSTEPRPGHGSRYIVGRA